MQKLISTLSLQFVLFLLINLISCREEVPKKISDPQLSKSDFWEIVPEQNLPVSFSDTPLLAPIPDSILVKREVLQQLLPDTIFQELFPEQKKLRMTVAGKLTTPEKSRYLFIRTVNGKEKTMYVLYFNEKGDYLGKLKLLDNEHSPKEKHRCTIDKRYNISLITEQKKPDGSVWTGEKIYYFDAEGLPIMAVTNTNEDLSNEILGNPIDSLPRQHKFSGDYSTDSKNLVSIRDGSSDNSFRFFIHFSKKNGNCIGELKGEADRTGKATGVYQDRNSPCMIEFQFSSKSVIIKEINGCGSYRDIACSFEGRFPKVKKMQYPKPSVSGGGKKKS
ncbi:MAG: hypothetical protein KGP35_09145 [Bacteroidetes bacterium]|nr:hypothetical protein [Bacteroidota bacterium]